MDTSKTWAKKTLTEWKAELAEIDKKADILPLRKKQLLESAHKVVLHMEKHGTTIAPHHQYELNGIMHSYLYLIVEDDDCGCGNKVTFG